MAHYADPVQDFSDGSGAFALIRRPFRSLNPARILRGGRIDDLGRLPRYSLIFLAAATAIWLPIYTYVTYTPPSFTSGVSLILPGSGASASVNLADLGQASSSSSSAFASSRVSPTVTYKRLLTANRVLDKAAKGLKLSIWDLGEPRIKLVDETSLIHFDISGPSPEDAQVRAAAVLDAFLTELDALRDDELSNRDTVARAAIEDYGLQVDSIRAEIEALQRDSGLLSFSHYEDLVAAHDQLRIDLAEIDVARDEAAAGLADQSLRLGTDADTAALNLRLHADPQFQQLAAKASEQSALFAEKRGQYGPNHPQVTSAERARDGALRQLFARAAAMTGHDEAQLQAKLDISPEPGRSGLLAALVAQAAAREELRVRADMLAAQFVQSKAKLDRLAPFATRLDDRTRDYQVAEAVFASALARTDTSKAEVYASYPLVQVLEDASLPEKPTSPKEKIAIAAGIAACLMVLMGLALAWIRQPLIDKLLVKGAA